MALTQLKALRKKHKMTQKQLANALGIDKMFETAGACCRTKKEWKALEMRNTIEEKYVDNWDYNWYD